MSLWIESRENPGKPEMVLLHGWGMSSAVWGAFADALSENFSLTLVDLPGLGKSRDYPKPYTTDAVVDLLGGHCPDQAIWLGWSMGGQIAVAFAERFPERVTKLITIASNPCFVERDDWPSAMLEKTHLQFEQSLSDNPDKTLVRFCMLQTQGAEKGKETLKMLRTLLADTTHTAPKESLSALRDDVRQQLGCLKLPILQLFGEKDLLVPASAAGGCERLTGQQTITYAGAGHLPFYSHQEQVLNDIMAFCVVEP